MENRNWLAVVIQGIILGNISILAQKGLNGYLVLSALTIIFLFAMQSFNRRFLLLFPINTFMKEPVQSIDTYILRILSSLYLITFFLGLLAQNYSKGFIVYIEKIVVETWWDDISFFLLLSVLWLFCFRKYSKQIVINKLKKSEIVYCPDLGQGKFNSCPKCEKTLKVRNKVISDEAGIITGIITYYCEECNFKLECPAKLNIAY